MNLPSPIPWNPWRNFWDFVIPSGAYGVCFTIGLVALLVAALLRPSKQLGLCLFLWVVVVGALYAYSEVVVSFGGSYEYLKEHAPWDMIYVFCSYGIRTSALLIALSPVVFRSLLPESGELKLMARTILWVVLLLSVDCMTLAILRKSLF
jgi:hypothetical protein